MKCKYIHSSDITYIEKTVNLLLEANWEVWGPLSAVSVPNGNPIYYQTLIKEKKDPNPKEDFKLTTPTNRIK